MMENRYSKVAEIGNWLDQLNDTERQNRIWRLGLLTGWRKRGDDDFIAPNFERALIIDRIIELIKPKAILEIGTGRGLGCTTAALAGKVYDCDLHVTTIDISPPDKKQDWAIQIDGNNKVIKASRNEIWSKYVNNELTDNILQITGSTTKVLPELLSRGRKYDFIFVDGGHDLYTVIHDLTYAASLLSDDGIILMDDFSPIDRWAIGINMSVHHAKKLFQHVSILHTEGIVFGSSENPNFPRGMVIMMKKKFNDIQINRLGLIYWIFIKKIIPFGFGKVGSPYKTRS